MTIFEEAENLGQIKLHILSIYGSDSSVQSRKLLQGSSAVILAIFQLDLKFLIYDEARKFVSLLYIYQFFKNIF